MNTIDTSIIIFFRKISVPLARIALFVIYVWFGVLKVIGMSPASPMVQELFLRTFPPIVSFETFIILFGLFEVLIGLLFIIPKCERVAIILFFLHMITTTLPLFVMISFVWTHMGVPTLEGQYIIKNLALIACAVLVGSSLTPKYSSNSNQ